MSSSHRSCSTSFTEDNKQPELWGWFASWDHTCLVKLFGGIPSPDWLPDFTHDLRAVLDYMNLPRSVYRRLRIWVVNHSAIADAWKDQGDLRRPRPICAVPQGEW